MNHTLARSTALLTILSLTACGNTSQDRVLSGAGLGAATGAVTSAVVGGSVGTGLLIGTAAGAVVGGVTDSNQLNLGKPLWKKGK
ncbi:MAG: hypothetical protein U1E36_06675 [Rickettsiales bacterium]